MWALATGVVVIVLARERYGFVPWVVFFLVLTWASTLWFGRRRSTAPRGEEEGGRAVPATPGVAVEATSYLTRTMYQETLFFLLPFYAYSTVVGEPSMVFTALLGTLAVLSCIDLLFDRWLRESALVGLLFFAVVTFAAVNLLIPILLPLDPAVAERIAAGVALVAALPLAIKRDHPSTVERVGLGVVAVGFLVFTLGLPQLVPPVPLRLQSATFASGIDRARLMLPDTLSETTSVGSVPEGVFVLFEVFAPTVVPTEVHLQWERDGALLREGRDIEITAHELGFRIWDAWRPTGTALVPGRYRVVMETRGDRVFGAAELVVRP